MMPVLRNILTCLLLVSFLFRGEVFAQEKETIRWLTWEQVPNYILDGKFQGQGIADTLTKTLQNKLPQYKHVNIVTNVRRYQRFIQEENSCAAWAWIMPGSRDYRLYSRPVSLAHRIGIHTLKSKQHLFGKPGEVLSLATLIANPNLKLGYLQGIRYSQKVGELLEQYKDQEHTYFLSPLAVEFDLKLLSRNRLDYFFGFPAQASYEAEQKDIPNKYQFYHIEEMPLYTSMHTHCSKTPFGEKVMEEVDKILTDEMLLEHLEVIERWYGQKKHYRDVFIDHVIQQNPNELVTHPGR